MLKLHIIPDTTIKGINVSSDGWGKKIKMNGKEKHKNKKSIG